MNQILLAHISGKITLSGQEAEQIPTYFVPKKLKRRQYALQQGEVCRNLTFVSKGLLRSFRVDERGGEHITLFACEGWWISDFNSYIHQEPAILSIDALEDSDLLQISRDAYERLLADIPAMERYFRILYQNSLVTKDRRLINTNGLTAENKYHQLLETMPDIVQRVPQHLIASYLGLAPETISRIKRKS